MRAYPSISLVAAALLTLAACEDHEPIMTQEPGSVIPPISSGASRAGSGPPPLADGDPGPVLTRLPDRSAENESGDADEPSTDPDDPTAEVPLPPPGVELSVAQQRALSQGLAQSPRYDADADPCNQAWEAVLHATSVTAADSATEGSPPNRERFMQGCAALPEELRPCLSIAYAREHREECVRLAGARPDALTRGAETRPDASESEPDTPPTPERPSTNAPHRIGQRNPGPIDFTEETQ